MLTTIGISFLIGIGLGIAEKIFGFRIPIF